MLLFSTSVTVTPERHLYQLKSQQLNEVVHWLKLPCWWPATPLSGRPSSSHFFTSRLLAVMTEQSKVTQWEWILTKAANQSYHISLAKGWWDQESDQTHAEDPCKEIGENYTLSQENPAPLGDCLIYGPEGTTLQFAQKMSCPKSPHQDSFGASKDSWKGKGTCTITRQPEWNSWNLGKDIKRKPTPGHPPAPTATVSLCWAITPSPAFLNQTHFIFLKGSNFALKKEREMIRHVIQFQSMRRTDLRADLQERLPNTFLVDMATLGWGSWKLLSSRKRTRQLKQWGDNTGETSVSLPPSSQVSRSETVLTLTQLTFPNKVYDKHMLIYSDDNFPKYMGGLGWGRSWRLTR